MILSALDGYGSWYVISNAVKARASTNKCSSMTSLRNDTGSYETADGGLAFPNSTLGSYPYRAFACLEVVSKNPLNVLKNLMIFGLLRISGNISKSEQNLEKPSKFIRNSLWSA